MPQGAGSRRLPRASSTIRQLFFFFVVFFVFLILFWVFLLVFFFSSIIFPRKKAKGDVSLERLVFVVVVVVFRGILGILLLLLFRFFKGRGRENLQQSPVFACDGHSWGSWCTVHAG